MNGQLNIKFCSLLPTFRDNLSGPSSKVKQSNKNARALTYVVYIGNDLDGDWFLIPLGNNNNNNNEM